MIGRSLALLVGVLAVLATACGGEQTEASDAPGAGATKAVPPMISEGVFHLGEDGGVEPTINLELTRAGSFVWRTDPGRYGDWIPSGSGMWRQAGEIITLRPSESDRSMSFAPTLSSALGPMTSVVEASLRVEDSGTLVTVSVKEDNGETWSPSPSRGFDASQINWKRGRACTSSGRSNGC